MALQKESSHNWIDPLEEYVIPTTSIAPIELQEFIVKHSLCFAGWSSLFYDYRHWLDALLYPSHAKVPQTWLDMLVAGPELADNPKLISFVCPVSSVAQTETQEGEVVFSEWVKEGEFELKSLFSASSIAPVSFITRLTNASFSEDGTKALVSVGCGVDVVDVLYQSGVFSIQAEVRGSSDQDQDQETASGNCFSFFNSDSSISSLEYYAKTPKTDFNYSIKYQGIEIASYSEKEGKAPMFFDPRCCALASRLTSKMVGGNESGTHKLISGDTTVFSDGNYFRSQDIYTNVSDALTASSFFKGVLSGAAYKDKYLVGANLYTYIYFSVSPYYAEERLTINNSNLSDIISTELGFPTHSFFVGVV